MEATFLNYTNNRIPSSEYSITRKMNFRQLTNMKTLKNTTPVPNQVFSWLPELSGTELKCLLVIIRNTIGWVDKYTGERKERDWIANSVFASKGGISERSVTTAIESLLKKKIIKATGYGGSELSDPQKRKFSNRIYYQLNLDNSEKTAFDH